MIKPSSTGNTTQYKQEMKSDPLMTAGHTTDSKQVILFTCFVCQIFTCFMANFDSSVFYFYCIIVDCVLMSCRSIDLCVSLCTCYSGDYAGWFTE